MENRPNKIIIDRKNSKTLAVVVNTWTFNTTTQKYEKTGTFDLTGYDGYFAVKRRKDSKEYILYITGTMSADPTDGVITFTLTADDTDITPGHYVYDITVEDSRTGDRQTVVTDEIEIKYSINYEPAPTP